MLKNLNNRKRNNLLKKKPKLMQMRNSTLNLSPGRQRELQARLEDLLVEWPEVPAANSKMLTGTNTLILE